MIEIQQKPEMVTEFSAVGMFWAGYFLGLFMAVLVSLSW